ncbi:MAG TPA: DUF3817 domain-containing protein [Saprospiraceae bacterium]|nr:DUF3817 domain-containing protein [Saprospiraceae bacterium]
MTTKIAALRFLALAEGISYLAFGLTMPLKYIYEITGPNKVIGYAHGALFIAYCVAVFLVNMQAKWNFKTNFLAYLASLVPSGTFVADTRIFKPTEARLISKMQP